MYYIYHSRFQPLDIWDYTALEWLLKEVNGKEEYIVIGISNPAPNNTNPQDQLGCFGFLKEYNPLKYWQRHVCVSTAIKSLVNSLGDSYGTCDEIRSKIHAILPMPRRLSVDFESASIYLPPKTNKRTFYVPPPERRGFFEKIEPIAARLEREGEKIF